MDTELLKRILKARNISQRKLASAIGVHPQRITDVISGRLKGWKYGFLICRYLDVPEEALFPEYLEQLKRIQKIKRKK